MGRGHHHHEERSTSLRRLGWTLALVVAYTGAEVVGGYLTNSLALLADAGHMLSDAASLGLAIFAIWMAQRPRDRRRTFGYHRTEILAALLNGAALVAISVLILVEAWERWREPPVVSGAPMLVVAIGGLAINLAAMRILHHGRDASLNVRAAWLHVVADTLGSVQVIAAAALIWAFGWNWADPLASALVALLVVWSAGSLLRESVNVLMEATPRHLDAGEIRDAIVTMRGVDGVHDLHLWTITSGFDSFSAHVEVSDSDPDQVLGDVRRLLHERFGIEHSTIQIETGEVCGSCCARVPAT